MFNNLIESSSHTREFKRRGSFVLFTAATYFLLFVIAGVMSIYAYDARLSEPSTELELVSLIPPQPDVVVPEPARVPRNSPPAGAAAGPRSMRPVLIDTTDNPQNVPDKPSALASAIPPAHAGTVIGPIAIEPSGSGKPGGSGDPNPNGGGNVVILKTPDPPPLPPPTPKPVPRVISKGPITSQALSLPKPAYPPLAKRMGVQGSVSVQVLIDESGKVVSAKTVSGSPMLALAAQQAAFGARFSPTTLGGQAMKVSGVITYNFVLQ